MEKEYLKMAMVDVSSVGVCKCYIYEDGRMSYNSTAEQVRFIPTDEGDIAAYEETMAFGDE